MVTLGCDPEMRFSDNGYGIDAHDRLPGYAPFGCDGCSETVELRPGTSSNPLELVGKIKNVMEEGIREYDIGDLKWNAGHYAYGVTLGGHIHIGYANRCGTIKRRMVTNLAVMLSEISETFDDTVQREMRNSAGYGTFKEYDGKPYGIEFRQPGSWLISPEISLINLSVAKVSAIMAIQGVSADDPDEYDTRVDYWDSIRKLDSIEFPTDCKMGFSILKKMLKKNKRVNWLTDVKANWSIV